MVCVAAEGLDCERFLRMTGDCEDFRDMVILPQQEVMVHRSRNLQELGEYGPSHYNHGPRVRQGKIVD